MRCAEMEFVAANFRRGSPGRATMKLCMKAALAVAAIALTSAPLQAKQNIAELGEKCNKQAKESACRELEKLATKDRDESVRQSAVTQLRDQALLARIAVQDDSEKVQLAAVANLNDQSLLRNVAVTAS